MNKKKSGVIVCMLVALLSVGCANTGSTAQSAGIKTVADAQLRNDVLKMIALYESAAGGNRNPSLVSATFLSKEGPTFNEQWVVDSNGKNIPYKVRLTPSPGGGVNFVVTREVK
jgi:hypothetical protein